MGLVINNSMEYQHILECLSCAEHFRQMWLQAWEVGGVLHCAHFHTMLVVINQSAIGHSNIRSRGSCEGTNRSCSI